MRVGVATIQRGRARHLARQSRGIARQTRAPERRVVVSMDPDGVDTARAAAAGARVVHLPVPDGAPLPLSAARNAAVAALGDVDLAVLLDVDCIPGPGLVARYADAWSGDPAVTGATAVTGSAVEPGRLLAGPVAYLPAGRPAGDDLSTADAAAARPPAARAVPADGTVRDEPRHELFWSLSFAVAPEVHARIGGFDEGYVGYGGEDTDYAFRAREAGVGLAWVGGAWAYHQHHPVSHPPREHVSSIVPNARRFHQRWGRWPMEGWLAVFAAEGLVHWDPDGTTLELARVSSVEAVDGEGAGSVAPATAAPRDTPRTHPGPSGAGGA